MSGLIANVGIYRLTTILCWLILGCYWWYNSTRVKATVQAQSRPSRYLYLFFLLLGFIIVYSDQFALSILAYRLTPANHASGIAGTLICMAGIAFAIWARKTLGNNWSGDVTLKKGHDLVQSGPYKIVRHPIYTGFEIGILGVAVIVGQLKGLLGLSIVFAAHYYKTTMEEKLMYQQFGLKYAEYSKKVKRLIPFIF